MDSVITAVFSFSETKLKETSWGTIEYDYLDQKAMDELAFNEKICRLTLKI